MQGDPACGVGKHRSLRAERVPRPSWRAKGPHVVALAPRQGDRGGNACAGLGYPRAGLNPALLGEGPRALRERCSSQEEGLSEARREEEHAAAGNLILTVCTSSTAFGARGADPLRYCGIF